MRYQQSELWSYIDQAGVQYALDVFPRRVVTSEEGMGIPDINYVTQRGPFQHGVTMRSYFLSPRLVRLGFRSVNNDRDAYWLARSMLIDGIRPNKGAQGTSGVLRKRLFDGTLRQLDAVIASGPGFGPRASGVWDEFGFTETLTFVAHNPIWYDPTQHSQAITLAATATFPMTFPVTFLAYTGSATITYAGDWQEYPTIVITGRLKNPVITNTTTGESIALNYTIPTSATVTITLSYDAKTVVLSDGTNLIGYVATNSDLATFHLQPGANVITVEGDDGNTPTAVTIYYYDRYLGI